MERREHYWNMTHGTMARQDIYIVEDASRGKWFIEVRYRERFGVWEYESEVAARTRLKSVMLGQEWKRLP